mmetsp:Transcript_11124/g.24790  ORF Transcript_11124/g.24790 Transcript_11124/m.24790 type:complete len:283 (-) Transcript_11124:21-869(-)
MDQRTTNSNPTVLEKSSLHHKRHALEWPELAAINADAFTANAEFPNDNEEVLLSSRYLARPKRSPEDVATANALSDASIATHGKATSLLRNFGLNYPLDESQRLEMAQKNSAVSTFAVSPLDLEWIDVYLAEESQDSKTQQDEKERDPVDEDEIFDIIRNVQDPEHPLTLEQLGVVSREQISVTDQTGTGGPFSTLDVRFTPTIPHCSMATQIGLCLVVKLSRSLPRFKTTVRIEPGTHASEKAINKQLADKERVCAALENKHLLAIVNKCIINGMTGEMTA